MASKAFLSGINDYQTIGDLRGCINDTDSIRSLLTNQFGFQQSNIRVRTNAEVTKKELEKGWKWLLKGAKKGDRLVFHFSGHGSYTADTDGEAGEADFRDELLCLYGMDWDDPSSYLLDDELAEWTEDIPTGVHVTFLLDCCHSGSGTRFVPPPMTTRGARIDFTAGSMSLDTVAESRSQQPREFGIQGVLGTNPTITTQFNQQTVLARFAPPPEKIQNAIVESTKTRTIREAIKLNEDSEDSDEDMNHVLWSGCQDDQTSADAFINGDFHGAFTYYFCDSVIAQGGASSNSQSVAQTLRNKLRQENFYQIPQLEPSDTDAVLFGGKRPTPADSESSSASEPTLHVSRAEFQELLSTLRRSKSAGFRTAKHGLY